jgi:xanthine/CO dehydrogenase XdhC/CoxF family maturation factor
MTDLEHILPLWHELEASGGNYVLATVVAVEGPSYRKPGARMLIAQDGRRAGTVSGGCLEAEVARRAWWRTESGPVVERYSTVEDDGDMPYGSGCGGVVYLLLERRATAAALLTALEDAFKRRAPLAIATVLEGEHIGQRAFAGLQREDDSEMNAATDPTRVGLRNLAELAFARGACIEKKILIDEMETRAWADYRAARPGLWIFGAGDDAKPLVHLARELGWFVGVAEGRSHLATRERFRTADVVKTLPIADFPGTAAAQLDLRPTDAAVVMTHSFEQDSRILASLLALEYPLAYVGVLGPQRRTNELLSEAARLLNLPHPTDCAERWLAQMHAPTGIDLGAETPATIALSIVAEIQQTIAAASAQPLCKVRAVSTIATT